MVEEAETDLSAEAAEPAGRVVATAFPSAAVAFAPALARSLRTHPRLTLVLRQTLAGEGLRQVRSGDVDVAIVDDWTSRLAEEIELGGSILTWYHLIRDQLVLVLPRTHPAAADSQPVDLRALRHDPWLAAPAGEPSRRPWTGCWPRRAWRRRCCPSSRACRRSSAWSRAASGSPSCPGWPCRGGPQDRRPGPAARPRPGQGRVRGGPHRERAPSLGGGDRDRAARGRGRAVPGP
jgi:Transcriptional regulator